MEFENNYLFLVGIVGFLFWLINFFKFFKEPELYLPNNILIKKRSISRVIVFFSCLIGWSFLTLSLMNPKIKQGFIIKKGKANDIIFVLDVSRSMLAIDFKPNRLSVAKKKIKEFINLNPNERYGIILFSEKVYTHVPLTSDLDFIRRKVSSIGNSFLGTGTNIGDAIMLAAGRFNYSKAKNKYIILLTDGVSNVGSVTPIEAGKRLVNQKIKLFSIGIGKDQDAKIPVNSSNPFLGGYEKIPGGSIDFEILKVISKITLGRFYPAHHGYKLGNILKKIGKDEKLNTASRKKALYKYKYFPFLLLGVLFLFGGEVLRTAWIKEEL